MKNKIYSYKLYAYGVYVEKVNLYHSVYKKVKVRKHIVKEAWNKFNKIEYDTYIDKGKLGKAPYNGRGVTY